MDQDTRWLIKYNEVMEFREKNHRNPIMGSLIWWMGV